MKHTPMILVTVASLVLFPALSDAQHPSQRASSGYSYVISFGQEALPITAVSGGVLRGEAQAEPLDPGGIPRKRLVGTVVVPLSFESSLPGTLLPWVRDSVANPGEIRRNAELSLVDFEGRQRGVRTLRDAVVSKVSLPALDAGSKAPARVLLELRPGTIEYGQGSGAPVTPATTSRMAKSSLMQANFRLEIGDLPTGRISRVMPLTWTLSQPRQAVTTDRRYRAVSTVSVGNLVVYASEVDSPKWRDWFKSFVIEGKNDAADELSGTLTFLSADMQTPLLSIELHGLGIVALEENVDSEAQLDAPSRFMAEMYVERISIVPGP